MLSLFDHITVIPNCIHPQLIDIYLSIPRNISKATIGWGDRQTADQEYRVTSYIQMPEDIRTNTVSSIESLYNNLLIQKYKQNIKFIEPPQFLHYGIGGKYDVHNDSEDYVNGRLQRVVERDLTVLVYLNDNYEGGELELPDWGIKFKPKAGTLIAFPSYSEFAHVVHPVTRGERMNIVTWICTTDRIYKRDY